MALKKRGLGRGLDALLGNAQINQDGATNEEITDASPENAELKHIPIDLIETGSHQPRIDMHQDALEDLANSIRAQGVIQPIVLRPLNNGRYEIIAGERRWRAAQMAGLHDIPAMVKQVAEKTAIAIALIENIQREELNAIEEATALKRLVKEFGMTHAEIGRAVGRSTSAVCNLLRLLDLNSHTKQLLENGDLDMGHARALLSLDHDTQINIAEQVVAKELSVRQTESLVRQIMNPPQKKEAAHTDPDIQNLETDLSGKLGAKVVFQHSKQGKGKLVIHYNTVDELEGILAHIK